MDAIWTFTKRMLSHFVWSLSATVLWLLAATVLTLGIILALVILLAVVNVAAGDIGTAPLVVFAAMTAAFIIVLGLLTIWHL